MDTRYQRSHPELWGGIECTINRVGNKYRDQLELSGYYERAGDLEKIASLGIKKFRFPVLWERHQPSEHAAIDFTWANKELNSIREYGITPIVGLLHHGSGPAFTDLLDPAFPSKFAFYASQVARKFPWVNYYTPVNEPLTTARFSGLYGLWYPHLASERAFADILLNELKGTVLAMQAIRRINPAAKFVQTEDLSKIHSTRRLSYQADFENERRWLSNDLLCGLVGPGHAQWNYLRQLGISEQRLSFFRDNRVVPDIMGFNYYVTSERYLTENLPAYPHYPAGGNGRDRYVDVEATRSGHYAGVKALLKEAWDRYRLPLAISECHINCSCDEQIRWFREVWDAVAQLKYDGVKITGVTAWALLGAFDWDSLLTHDDNHYESGVFDISMGSVQETVLAEMLRNLARTGNYDHAALANDGWWHDTKKKMSATT